MHALRTLLPPIGVIGIFTAMSLAIQPNTQDIRITSMGSSGSGCPTGSVSTSISPDRNIITVGFDAFIVYFGPGTSPRDRSKDCALQFNVSQPSGFQFAVVETTWHGMAVLEAGMSYRLLATTYFDDDLSHTASFPISIEGGGAWAAGDVFTKSASVATGDAIYSPCGAMQPSLNVGARTALTTQMVGGAGQLPDDETPVLTMQLLLHWRNC